MKILQQIVFLTCLLLALPAAAWELSGKHQIILHGQDGSEAEIGSVSFLPEGDAASFKLDMDHRQLKDYFLSMREFKCREGQTELLCHVPYPYPNPARVTAGNLAWLEHALLFFHKSPRDFGAKLWNGVYFKLEMTPGGLVGTPQAIDLNLIGVPPADKADPPYGLSERSDMPAGARWFNKLTIR